MTAIPGKDLYAAASDPTAPAYLASGGDFEEIANAQRERSDEIMVVNFGPHHPSTHGVMRLILELDGETVSSCRPGIGFLHTGIEKNMEFRTWTQGVAYATRMNYVSSLLNESCYVLAVEKLLGVIDEIPQRAQHIRVMMGELQRIASHMVAIGTGGLEMGAMAPPMAGFRERDIVNDMIEAVAGLRMNQSFFRPGGVANDLPSNGIAQLKDVVEYMEKMLPDYDAILNENPIVKKRMCDVAVLDLPTCMALGVTGPRLRATGLPWDLRKTQPYFAYEQYDFDVATWNAPDAYGAYRVRLEEMYQSTKILKQCIGFLEQTSGEPVMIADKKIAWPAQLSLGPDGQGNSNEHIKHIMGESMEALIHHFKIVTEGFKVPAGQVYAAVENSAGELGCHLVSDGGNRPYRVHFRDPGFNHVQAIPAATEGSMIADVVVALASLDPVMGGVDR